MYTFTVMLLKALQITLTDIVLSGDNVGVIALAIRDLPPDKAKQAGALGVTSAFLLRMVFVALISMLFSLDWLHINLIGGVILLFITYSMIKDEKKNEAGVKKTSGGFLRAVASIVIADVSMSLDNVLAIAAIAIQDGGRLGAQEMGLVIFGLAVCIPIIFFGSGLVAKLMKRLHVIIHICAGLLVYTAVNMIFEDTVTRPFALMLNGRFGSICAIVGGAAVIINGIVLSLGRHKKYSS